MAKLTLTPQDRAELLKLRAEADAFAQQPVVKMTEEETIAFLNAAPVRPAPVLSNAKDTIHPVDVEALRKIAYPDDLP